MWAVAEVEKQRREEHGSVGAFPLRGIDVGGVCIDEPILEPVFLRCFLSLACLAEIRT